MRLLLLLYTMVFLTLNFFFEDGLVFLLAITTFPVSLYLLLSKPKAEQQEQPSYITSSESRSLQQEDSH